MHSATIVIDSEGLVDRVVLEEYVRRGLAVMPWILEDATDEVQIGKVILSLSGQPLSLIRVIVVRSGMMPVGDEVHSAEASLTRRLLQETEVADATLIRGVLVSPHPETALSTTCFHPDWNYNILLPRRFATGVRGHLSNEFDPNDSAQVSWSIFLALGMGCGLFTFLRAGLFDGIPAGSADGGLAVRAADLYLRIVDCGDAVTELISRVLQGRNDRWPVPPNLVEGIDSGQVVAELASQSCGRLGLFYRPIERSPETGEQHSVGSSVSLFLKQLLLMGNDELVTASYAGAGRAISWFEAKVQSVTLGDDVGDAVSVGEDLARFKAYDLQRKLSHLEAMPGISVPRPTDESRVWGSLRTIALSIIDGGDFPSELSDIQPTWDGRRVVVPERSLVIAPPRDAFGELEDSVAAEEESALKYDECIDGASIYERSFWNRIEASIEEAADDAWAALDDMKELWEQARVEIEEAEVVGSQKRRWLRWLMAASYVLVAIAVLGFAWLFRVDAETSRFQDLASSSGVLFILAVIGAAVALKGLKDANNRIRRALADGEYAESEFQNAVSQFARMSQLRSQADDWRQILATVVHRPLGWPSPPEESRALPIPAIQNLAVATPNFDSQTWKRTTLEMRRQLNGKGWLRQMYRRNLDVWQEHDAYVRNPLQRLEQDPEADRSIDPQYDSIPGTDDLLYNPRHQFARQVTMPGHAARVLNQFRADVDGQSRRVIIEAGLETTGVSVEGQDEVELVSFLGDILRQPSSSVLELFASNAVERELLTSGVDVASGVSTGADSSRPMISGFDHQNLYSVDNQIVVASYRAHLSQQCSPGSLSILDAPREAQTWTAPEQDGPVL